MVRESVVRLSTFEISRPALVRLSHLIFRIPLDERHAGLS